MNQLTENFQKYIFSALLVIAGIAVVAKGISGASATADNSDISWTLFLISGYGLLIGGVISALLIAGILNRLIAIGVFVVFLAGAVYLAYANYTSIQDRIALEKKYDFIRNSVKQGLVDIRDIEVEYKKVKGEFTGDFDSLVNFVVNEKTYDIKRTGTVPAGKIPEKYWSILGYKKNDPQFFSKIESWDEDEAVLAGKIKRDTIYKSLLEDIFSPENKSQQDRMFKFNPDSIRYVRNYNRGTLKFKLKADTLNDGTPVFMAKEPEPFHIIGKDKDTLQVGSLKEAKTTGNWGEL